MSWVRISKVTWTTCSNDDFDDDDNNDDGDDNDNDDDNDDVGVFFTLFPKIH